MGTEIRYDIKKSYFKLEYDWLVLGKFAGGGIQFLEDLVDKGAHWRWVL